MTYHEDYLKQLVKQKVIGDFFPFDTGKISEVEKYIKKIINKLARIHSLIIEPDYNYYGSGFASYINIQISKKDKSDTRETFDGIKRTEWKKGLLLYVSNLSPFWYYGGCDWTVNYQSDKITGGSGGFLGPESIKEINYDIWSDTLIEIKKIFNLYRYNLLAEKELSKELWFDINIPTILADQPYKIFDCFFYWED